MTANPKNDTHSVRAGAARRFLVSLAVVACVATGGYFLYQKQAYAQTPSETEAEPAGQPQRVSVVTTPAAVRDFERSVMVQGNVEARNFAMVSPRIPGTIEAIFVDEGDAVVAGETKLFQTDAANLERALQIKQQATTVAGCATREAVANLDKTRVDFHKAELDYNRFKRLYEKQAVTADAFERQESRYQQLQAIRTLAEAQVELATAREDQSKTELEIANKDLADATITTPISGRVSLRLQEPGEMGSPGRPVLRIDDPTVVEVAAFLPAQYYGQVVTGQTPMRVAVSGIDLGRQIITYKSPTINPKLRTFEVKCVVQDAPAGVAPGAMAQIAVVFETRTSLGVPSVAIQERGGRSVVFAVENDAIRQVPVTTGIESDGWLEIREGDLKEAAAVVTMGQYMVEAGTPVTVQEEN